MGDYFPAPWFLQGMDLNGPGDITQRDGGYVIDVGHWKR